MEEVVPKVIPVMLTGEDARVFMAFKENREKFLVLLNAGVFGLDYGQAEINIHNSQIQNIHLHRMTYKREKLSTS